MGFSSFFSVPLPCSSSGSSSPSCIENRNVKYIAPKSSDKTLPVVTSRRFSRRLILQFVGLSRICHACPVLAAPIMPEMKEPEVLRTFKLDSGVRIQDIVEGEGPEARGGDLVEFNYVCRRANGYFVYSTVDQFSGESKPVILPLDENQMIEGLKEVLTGMRIGGKRRALVPPSVGYVNENLQPVPEEWVLRAKEAKQDKNCRKWLRDGSQRALTVKISISPRPLCWTNGIPTHHHRTRSTTPIWVLDSIWKQRLGQLTALSLPLLMCKPFAVRSANGTVAATFNV